MKKNVHKIYYLGSNKFLKVERERGVSPASWNRTVLSFRQLFYEIKNYYGSSFELVFKNNAKLHIAYKASKDEYEFIQNVRYLMKETPITGELHEYNTHTKSKGMVIYDYAISKKMYVVI